jgi:uncharacterized protein (TIGR02265 family)
MAETQLVFEQAVVGLLKGIGDAMTPAIKQNIKQAGLDLDRKLLPAYGVDAWERIVVSAAQGLYPGLELSTSMARVGARLMDGYFSGGIGKALSVMVKMIGPRQTLKRMQRNFRTANNYSECVLIEHGRADYTLKINEPGALRYMALGILQAGLVYAGAQALTVSIETFDPLNATYRIQWQPAEKLQTSVL